LQAIGLEAQFLAAFALRSAVEPESMAGMDQRVNIGKLAELVKRDYDFEVQVIKDTGNLWSSGFGLLIVMAFLWGSDFLSGKPWSRREIAFTVVCIVVVPFIQREWKRHKVAAQMRHEREIRVEAKVDALLGLVNIKNAEDAG
jgi:hypothetical protein